MIFYGKEYSNILEHFGTLAGESYVLICTVPGLAFLKHAIASRGGVRRWWTRKLVGLVALMTLLNGVGRDDFEPSSI